MITAVVLAAGQSKRMAGPPKQLLPWGDRTVLGQTLANVQAAMVADLLVVTGHAAQEVGEIARRTNARTCYNPQYATGEMLSSLQCAVAQHLPENCKGILVVLADQPMIPVSVYDRLITAYNRKQGTLIAPIYYGRRGNPVLIGHEHFRSLLALPDGAAPRNLLQTYADELFLVEVDTATVCQDIDLMEDYLRWRPQ